ncbi:hypothetical protein [Cohnella fermenti]|uniref:hypothetical protein n=1 Tax=Cohnella fermenti TaxID=2565925 RepID=UPI001E322D5B|nr:hypothetical protein [Cohnella fermenti]
MTFNMYHYYDKNIGPFKNLPKLSIEAAEEVSNQIKADGKTFASQRSNDYMDVRRELESKVRTLIIHFPFT